MLCSAREGLRVTTVWICWFPLGKPQLRPLKMGSYTLIPSQMQFASRAVWSVLTSFSFLILSFSVCNWAIISESFCSLSWALVSASSICILWIISSGCVAMATWLESTNVLSFAKSSGLEFSRLKTLSIDFLCNPRLGFVVSSLFISWSDSESELFRTLCKIRCFLLWGCSVPLSESCLSIPFSLCSTICKGWWRSKSLSRSRWWLLCSRWMELNIGRSFTTSSFGSFVGVFLRFEDMLLQRQKNNNLLINPCPSEPGIACLCKQCWSRSVGFWLLKKPTDLDLHWLSLSIWICMNNLAQVI